MEASSFIIVELDGQRRMLELIGRALPYRPFSLSGSFDASFQKYPGNPVRTVQALGPTEKPTTIRGYWKDKYLGVPTAAQATLDNVPLTTAEALVDAVDSIKDAGQLLWVRWDSRQRYGLLVDFKQDWYNRHDVEFEIEFEWTSKTTPVAVSGTHAPSVADDAANWQNAGAAVKEAASLPLSVGGQVQSAQAAPDFAATIRGLCDTVSEAMAYATSVSFAAMQQTLAPVDAAREMISMADSVKTTAAAVQATLYQRALVDTLGVAIDAADEGSLLAAEQWRRNLWRQMRDARGTAARQQDAYGNQIVPDAQAVFVAPDGTELRNVASIYYGDPGGWRDLMTANGLTSSLVPAGTVIVVPARVARAA